MRADPWVTHVLDLMRPWAPVTARTMFGGYGLKREGVNFALVADDMLYLKVDAQTQAQFAACGSAPFVYESKGRSVALSYWRAPEECLESPTAMQVWCEWAWQAALRAARPSSTHRRRSARMKS